MATALLPIKDDVAELRKAAGISSALAGIYQSFRLAFFKGKQEPLAIPNIDYLIFSAMFNDIRFLRYDSTSHRIILTKDGVLFATDAYFYVLLELFASEEYQALRGLTDRPFVIYDLGMNRGYASLWFANHPLCREVHGFELVEETYQFALDNFALNPRLAPKITAHCLGLGRENKTASLLYETATDGVSTIMPEFYRSYWTAQRKQRCLRRDVQIRKASEVFASLPVCQDGMMRILKIDVEGAEYDILEDLTASGQLNFDVIVAEAHLGLERFLALAPDYRLHEVVRHSEQMANVILVRAK